MWPLSSSLRFIVLSLTNNQVYQYIASQHAIGSLKENTPESPGDELVDLQASIMWEGTAKPSKPYEVPIGHVRNEGAN